MGFQLGFFDLGLFIVFLLDDQAVFPEGAVGLEKGGGDPPLGPWVVHGPPDFSGALVAEEADGLEPRAEALSHDDLLTLVV